MSEYVGIDKIIKNSLNTIDDILRYDNRECY